MSAPVPAWSAPPPARPAGLTARALGLDRGDLVHEVVRVRSANREPLAIEQTHLPAALFPDLLEHRLTGSLYTLLAKTYDHAPHTATEVLEPVIASAEQAGLLHVDAGSPLMRIERTTYTASGVAVEFARDVFRADRTRITLRAGRRPDPHRADLVADVVPIASGSSAVGVHAGALRVEQRLVDDATAGPTRRTR